MEHMSADKKDLEILRLIQEDCKRPMREISEEIDSPITTVYARIKRLENFGIVKGYKAVLNAEKLGKETTAFILASFSYRIPGTDRMLSQREIAKEVAKFSEVQEVHIITGDWDILIKIKERDVVSIGRFVVDKLRAVRGIERTLTCMVFDSAKETLDIAI